MAVWMGWSDAYPSQPTWNEWLERQELHGRNNSAAEAAANAHGAHAGRKSVIGTPAVSQPNSFDSLMTELERFVKQLALENIALKAALHQWQYQPAAPGVAAASGLA